MGMTRRSLRMAKSTTVAGRRARQRAKHARIKRQRGCQYLPVYKKGGPKPFGDKLSSATTATPAVAAGNPQYAVVTAVIPPQQKKQANKRAVTKSSPLSDKLALGA